MKNKLMTTMLAVSAIACLVSPAFGRGSGGGYGGGSGRGNGGGYGGEGQSRYEQRGMERENYADKPGVREQAMEEQRLRLQDGEKLQRRDRQRLHQPE